MDEDNVRQFPSNPFNLIRNAIGSDKYVLLFISESGSTGYSFGDVTAPEIAHLKTILDVATNDIYRETYGSRV